MKVAFKYSVVTLITLFALITLFMSGSVIFNVFGIREMEGNYVLIVVWGNFIASIIYLISAYVLFKEYKWSAKLLFSAVLLLILAFVGFYIHIHNGGLFEEKTIKALIFRILFTLLFTFFAYKITKNKNNS